MYELIVKKTLHTFNTLEHTYFIYLSQHIFHDLIIIIKYFGLQKDIERPHLNVKILFITFQVKFFNFFYY